MNVRDLTNLLEKDGKLSQSRFEALVLRLLDVNLSQEHKPFSRHVFFSSGFRLHGIAEEGVAGLPGPTVVEVKARSRATQAITKHSLQKLKMYIQGGDFRSVLFVVSTTLNPRDRSRLHERLADVDTFRSRNIQFEFWDLNNLAPLVQQYAEYVSDVLPGIEEVAVANVIDRSLKSVPEEWKEKREQHIDKLRRAFTKDELTLFLGAGVSQSAGLPGWDLLLSKLFVRLVEKELPAKVAASPVTDSERQVVAKRLSEQHKSSPLLVARYLRSGLGDSFEDAVSEALYEPTKSSGSGTSNLLQALTRLCVPRRGGLGIRSIVTYNFDDLVEQHLEDAGLDYRSVYRDIDVASREEVGIHHVHGFLPQDVENYNGLGESLLVFSEESYHVLLSDPFSWSNIVQVNALRESTCLLIGLSVTDPNLRRLLDTAKQRGGVPKHYVFMERVSAESFDLSVDGSLPTRPEVIEELLLAHHGLLEKSYRDLGLNIIWVEQHEDIPALLNSIRPRHSTP